MSAHWLDPSRIYQQLREDALRRIELDRQAGGDRATLAPVHERLFDEHRTATREKGDPCTGCGQPWPCASFAVILAPE